MPKKDITVNLPGIVVKSTYGYNPLIKVCKSTLVVRCPRCSGKRVRKKCRITRIVTHENIGDRVIQLHLQGHKYLCRDCGRYFNQRFAGISPRCQSSQKLKEALFRFHKAGINNKELAQLFGLSQSTIERYLHEFFDLQNRELSSRKCPKVLGIDEHRFSRKYRFATTFCDLRKHKVFDVVKGKSSSDLKTYLEQLPGKDNVKVICIDLCHPYRRLIQRYFPNAKIVADRFHVVRIIGHHFMKTCQAIDPKIKYQRGILKLLRMRPDRLSPKQIKKRDLYFEQYPAIKALYDKKQEIHQLMLVRQQTAKRCRDKHIPKLLSLVDELKQIAFEHIRTLAKTLDSWKQEIACMWRFSKNNGITEGFHRKMKLIQRRAYGFRNFENYRMRVRILCA